MRNAFSSLTLLALALVTWCGACSSTGQDAEPPKAAAKSAPKPEDFSIEGYYAEACSCSAPCPCELTGPSMGCKGVGAYQFTKGSYAGADFSGARVAYSLYLGEEVRLYIDESDAAKRAAAEKFMRLALAGFGPIKAVRDAKVEIAGKDGAYTIKVDGGKVMTCTTEPTLGGDHKTPVVHSNTFDTLNPVMYQGQCTGCTYNDGAMKISLDKGRNSYFNAHMQAAGKL